MAKKHGAIMQELDINEVSGYTEAQKTYYASLGFKPYLNYNGKVKWLMPDQHSLRIVSAHKRPWLSRLLLPKHIKLTHRRKHRTSLVKFIKINWGFLLLFLLIIGGVVLIISYPQILF